MSLITIPNSNLLTLKLNLLKKRLSILNLVVSLQSEEQKHLFYKIDFIHSCKKPKDLFFLVMFEYCKIIMKKIRFTLLLKETPYIDEVC